MDQGSYEYNLLVQWIEQGMPYGTDSDPYVVESSAFLKLASCSGNLSSRSL